MTYKEMVFFCTSILALKANSSFKSEVKTTILNGVDWDKFVVFSTNHYVLPALYICLRDVGFLKLLPTDLVAFMKNLTLLNSERNKRLISEVYEINALLISNNITPIFLKGAAHLCIDLYSNIGLRMIGDIDLLVAPIDLLRAAKVLEKQGYQSVEEFVPHQFENMKHYPRLSHKDKLVAVEINKSVVKKKRDRQLDYQKIDKTKQKINGVFVPSYENLVLHNTINAQMNDLQYLTAKINLRQQYDLFLLSKFVDVQKCFEAFSFHQNKLNAYLVKTAFIFQNDSTLYHTKNYRASFSTKRISAQLNHPKIFKHINAFVFVGVQLNMYLCLVWAHLANRKDRRFVLNKILSNKWWKGFLERKYKGMKSN